MAKKKKGTHHRPHRRVGNTGSKGIGMTLLGLAAGSVAAKVIHNTIGGMNPKIVSSAMAVGGAILAEHAKNPIVKGAALGVAAVGASELLTEFGVVHGIGAAVIDFLPENYTAKQVISGMGNRKDKKFNPTMQGKQVISGENRDTDAMAEMVQNDKNFRTVLY